MGTRFACFGSWGFLGIMWPPCLFIVYRWNWLQCTLRWPQQRASPVALKENVFLFFFRTSSMVIPTSANETPEADWPAQSHGLRLSLSRTLVMNMGIFIHLFAHFLTHLHCDAARVEILMCVYSVGTDRRSVIPPLTDACFADKWQETSTDGPLNPSMTDVDFADDWEKYPQPVLCTLF